MKGTWPLKRDGNFKASLFSKHNLNSSTNTPEYILKLLLNRILMGYEIKLYKSVEVEDCKRSFGTEAEFHY